MKEYFISFLIGISLLLDPSFCIAKAFPAWPVPTTLRVVQVNSKETYWMMTLVALQGLVNRQAPDGNMIYLEIDGFPDRSWRDYYVSRLGLSVVENTAGELLNWVRSNSNIRYYIVIDPYSGSGGMDKSHTCTINIASTMAGVFGNAVPVHPSKIAFLRMHGFTLLPDAYRNSLGPGGTILRRPWAFDLRNQWKTKHPNAPWSTRQDAYRWALDTLVPLVETHAITLNYGYETLGRSGTPSQFEPWINDYSIGTKQFHYYFNPNPDPPNPLEKTTYDYNMYSELLDDVGYFTMVRGWHWDEGANIGLISKKRCYHGGSRQMANASVHAALSPLFNEPFSQRFVTPDSVDLDPNKIYLTFSVTDGDQFGVVYRYYEHYDENSNAKPLWNDVARGQIPVNWTMSGLMVDHGRGIMRWFFDHASPKDYFTADLPVGYAWFTYEHFGELLNEYEAFANPYLSRSGMPVADFLPGYGTFPLISDPTIAAHVNGLTNAIAIREGYSGGAFYQGIHWPEAAPLMPYIRNTYCAGCSMEHESGRQVADQMIEMGQRIPWRPLFMHLTWSNWAETPSDMLDCIKALEKDDPGRFQLVGMPEFVALAQKAKMTGQYPMEIYPHFQGQFGLEGPYLWEDRGSTTSERLEFPSWRATKGGNYVAYKFNLAPAERATLTVEIEGNDYRVDISSDGQTWTKNLIGGNSQTKVTRAADLAPYLNTNGSVYIRFAGETKLWYAGVKY